ncbi:hypothetical protein HYH03_018810 [Edaphochlamys debaryana]|uniref:SRCR domain-containing protein n=1 Tax=Edaphochlamys debaryana TaxID=47281 RepID=A0A836BMY4_9CHLO|nr:hypothetical protein HYH03_018810 [Edaphochlamys debaryana]|eukprot:KAG2482247.1 hypothetical protein HYH03_018810 [Edaphochlamys debaryana]
MTDADGVPLPDPELLALYGFGLIKVLTDSDGLSSGSGSYLCGDPWAGWNAAAANIVCRQLGYPAGGDPLRVWRRGDLPPLLLGKLGCTGSESSLSNCSVSAVPGKFDAWELSAPASETAGVCFMLAGVRCRDGLGASADVALRAAALPAPSNTTTASDPSLGASPAFVARLEASIAGSAFGAVCAEGGFDDAAADVACRSLGFPAGGVMFTAGAAVSAPNSDGADPTADIRSSFLGRLGAVACGGGEASLGECAGWRAPAGAQLVPCRAAVWVACRTAAGGASPAPPSPL